jgi:hypothetical protein
VEAADGVGLADDPHAALPARSHGSREAAVAPRRAAGASISIADMITDNIDVRRTMQRVPLDAQENEMTKKARKRP